jgi:hypothetical protein
MLMPIPFTLRRIAGRVDVSITANTDPDAIGYSLLFEGSASDSRRGFPICRARVDYPADGYAAVFGWTQMVCSTDQTGQFEMDPIAIYAHVATPFAWFGVKPEAFDAPSRGSRDDMVWEAHCFLCVSPDAVLTRRVQAICGFRWGFTIETEQIHIAKPEVLAAQTWDAHLDLLRASYPSWTFDESYVGGSRSADPTTDSQ